MARLPYAKLLFTRSKYYSGKNVVPVRNLMSKQLTYSMFGNPLEVVKFKECHVPLLGSQEVLVKMLAAPVNPADINTIQGKYPVKVTLPTIPGNEGVGVVEEIGKEVKGVCPGNKVILSTPLQGTWRNYGVFSKDVLRVVPDNLGLVEAATLTVNPCTAYRMLTDFKPVKDGHVVIQNGGNSACGQNVIQICKAWGVKNIAVVRNRPDIDNLKKYLECLGATYVLTEEELRTTNIFKDKQIEKPVLALNCVGGKSTTDMLRHLQPSGHMVTYGGRNLFLPKLPHIPGDEGVGDVVEIGKHVCAVIPGNRVVFTTRLLGTWRYYGIYNERHVHVIPPNIPIGEASMITIAPCMAYRMLKDFKKLRPGQTVVQNAANSPCGQCVIQLCKAWGIKTLNIITNQCGCPAIKEHLFRLGATAVYTLEEVENITCFNTSLERPTFALNCLGGRYEDVMLRLLERNGVIVYYGSAFDLPLAKMCLRRDVLFFKFHMHNWNKTATPLDKDIMLKDIIELIVLGNFKAPAHEPLLLKNYVHALRNTANCEAFSTNNFVFDFTLS